MRERQAHPFAAEGELVVSLGVDERYIVSRCVHT